MTGAGISIRTAGLDDMPAVTAIYAHAVLHGTGTFELEPPDVPETTRRFARITTRGFPYLVACRGAEVTGYAHAFAYHERQAYRFTLEDSVYVDARWHGQGVGRALLDRLLEAARDRGCRQMLAVIGDSANLGSIKLHERAGFVPAGVLRDTGWKFGRWLDVVLMQRALGPGGGAPPRE